MSGRRGERAVYGAILLGAVLIAAGLVEPITTKTTTRRSVA